MAAIPFEQFVDEAMELPLAQRTALATRLIDSIDEATESISPAWQEELNRRVTDIDQGRSELIGAGEVWNRVNERFCGDL